MQIVTRSEARRLGLKRYFTGKSCKQGHLVERYTSKSVCVECDKISSAKYVRTPQGKINAHIRVSLRRARKKRSKGKYSEKNIRQIFADQFGKCKGCNRKFSTQLKYTIDHIYPLSKGGSSWPENIQLLCGSCNSKKGNKIAHDWKKFQDI